MIVIYTQHIQQWDIQHIVSCDMSYCIVENKQTTFLFVCSKFDTQLLVNHNGYIGYSNC